MGEAYRDKPSGTNEDDIIQNAHNIYEYRTGKRFNLMHWWHLLKDQSKWKSECDQSLQASSKRLRINELGSHSQSASPGTPSTPATPINHDSDETPTFVSGGIVQPMGQKAAKRKAKVQANDPVGDVLSKELAILGASKIKDSEAFS